MERSRLPGFGERLVYQRGTAGEEQPRGQRGSRVHYLTVVVVLVFRPPADGHTLAVAGGAWRPARGLARSGAWYAAAKHRALGSSVGRRIQDLSVHGARLLPRGSPVLASDPANGAR